jgi:hypothetical protein
MVSAYPTAVLIEDGKVRQKWIGEIPREYLERIRQFFEAIAVLEKPERGGFSG